MSRITSAVLVRLAKLIRLVRLINDGMPSSIKVKSVRYTPSKMSANAAALDVGRTKERDARRIREMQLVSVFPKILRTTHEHSDLFQYGHCFSVNLGPSSSQSVYWSCSQRRDNGEQGREIIHHTAFLLSISKVVAFSGYGILTSATDTKCLMTTTLFLTSD